MQQVGEEKLVIFPDGFCDTQRLLEMIAFSETQDDPFYICDVREIIRRHEEWAQKLPRVKPFYAVKANNVPIVLKTLEALGIGFDCASMGEINNMTEIGTNPERIIFANTVKSKSALRRAKDVGVKLMTFDNEEELRKIKEVYPTAQLLIRIKTDATKARVLINGKFGCHSEEEAPFLMGQALTFGLSIVGVAFHVGSGSREPSAFCRTMKKARHLFDLGLQMGYNMKILDIGGGFPGSKGSSIDQFVEAINSSLDDYFPDPNVFIMAEPGRYFTASSMTLAAQIIGKKEATSVEPVNYFLNEGTYGSFNRSMYLNVEPKPLTTKIHKVSPKLELCTIYGPTCDPNDIILDNIHIPKMNTGDWIIFDNFGAYSSCLGTKFNGFPQAHVFCFADQSHWRLLKKICSDMKISFIFADEYMQLDNSLWNDDQKQQK